MAEINCYCGGKLSVDYDETKKNGITLVYYCSNCGKLFVLKPIGEKERGWKTKKLLDNKRMIEGIPF